MLAASPLDMADLLDPEVVDVLGIAILTLNVLQYAHNHLFPEPYNTSILSGPEFMTYLLNSSHPDKMPTVLGASAHVFYKLLDMLISYGGLSDSREVDAIEKLGIFLWLGRYNASIREIGERFQRSPDTIHRYANL
jgi:hypothetical protein